MKSIITSTVIIGLAVSLGYPAFAVELNETDPVVASFIRDLNREPTPTSQITRDAAMQDPLPEIFRAALEISTQPRPGTPTLARRD